MRDLVHRSPFGFVSQLPARALLALIRVYQRVFSPTLHALLGPSCGCRFAPTCSHYAAEAVQTHGLWRGLDLAVRRIIKCTPLHPGGLDPVPPRESLAPRCTRVTPTTLTSLRS